MIWVVYGSLGESTSSQEKSMKWVVYGSLGHSTGSLEQSTKVYRDSTAVQVSIRGVYGSLGQYTGRLWESLAVQGNVRRVCASVGRSLRKSRAVNGTIGDSTVV